MCLSRRYGSVFPVFAALIVCIAPAKADMRIDAAKITAGDLWVLGNTGEPDTDITLDGRFPQRTDSRGAFEFHVVYHPATCIATLRTPKQVRSVVVGEGASRTAGAARRGRDPGRARSSGGDGTAWPPGCRGPGRPAR